MRKLVPVPQETPTEPMVALPMVDPRPLAELAVDEAAERGAKQRSRIVVVATIFSILWFAAAAAAIYLIVRYLPAADLTLTGLAAVAAGVAAPLTAIWLIALVFARVAPGEAQAALKRIEQAEARFSEVASRTRRELDAIDGVLSAVATRVDGLRGSIGSQAAALMETAGQMEWRSAAVSSALGRDREAIELLLDRLSAGGSAARAELAAVIDVLPQAERQAVAIETALASGAGSARRQIDEVGALLASVWTHHARAQSEADISAARLRDTLATADAEGSAASERFEARRLALASGIDSALARAADALEAARGGVEAQVDAVVTATAQAQHILVDLGGDAAKAVSERLAAMADEAARLTGELAAQEVSSRALVDSVERSFGVLDAKLANAAQTSATTLERLDERLTGVRGQIHDLATPLTEAGNHVRVLGETVAQLKAGTETALAALDAHLPVSLAQTGSAIDDVRAAMKSLTNEAEQTLAMAAAVQVPAEAGVRALGEATAALAAQRDALDSLVGQIETRLTAARTLVGEVEAGADSAALVATGKLVEAMTRAREVAGQAEGAMRDALNRAIGEAHASLAKVGDETMRSAFTAPIEAQLAGLRSASEATSDAARDVSERMSRQLFALVEAAGTVESRMSEADAKLEAASRDDLARRGALLIDALNSSSIDIAKALATDVTDSAWAAYLKGDRSVFTRRAVKLLDGGAARGIARTYENDGEFRDSARRYIHDFEALMRRVMDEREGGPLQVALLSSDVGKLYVALAQALERIRS